jgi:7-cyano-7-deazaguanine reductase
MLEQEPLKRGEKMILENKLEPIPFKHAEPKTLIYFTCPEGTSLCPRTGFPDFWAAHIWYVPKSTIVELKSLKLYLNAYRSKGIYHEELPHLILKDLKENLDPLYMKIVIDHSRRGNIQTDVIVEHKAKDYDGPIAPEWEVRYGLK